jgi:4-hydroxy-4-methyl-2-oxoglutarate aldolase
VALLLTSAAEKVTAERVRIEEIASGRNIRPAWLDTALRAAGLLGDKETL